MPVLELDVGADHAVWPAQQIGDDDSHTLSAAGWQTQCDAFTESDLSVARAKRASREQRASGAPFGASLTLFQCPSATAVSPPQGSTSYGRLPERHVTPTLMTRGSHELRSTADETSGLAPEIR